MTPISRAFVFLCSGILSLALVLYLSRFFVYDDAYISFRYAKNLAEHRELVWNLGERVEGITNFLYTIALAPLLQLGVDAVAAARGINFLALFALLLSYRAIARRALPGTENADARAVGALLLLGAAPIGIWTMGALEAVPVAALLLIGLERLSPSLLGERIRARRAIVAGLAFAGACLTRLDAGVVVFAVLAGFLLSALRPWRERLSLAAWVAGVAALFLGAQVAWRYGYYGALLPNTFEAKVGVPISHRLDFGIGYLGRSIVQIPLLAVALVLLLIPAARPARGDRLGPLFKVMTAAVLAQLIYVLWAGGDHLPAARFVAVALGPAAILLALAFARLGERTKRAFAVALPFPVLLLALVLPTRQHGGAEAGLIVGDFISRTMPKDYLVAVNVAGATAYAAPDHKFIDQLGLNDRTIAARNPVPMRMRWQRRPGHAKGDAAYVLSREPDIILLGPADGVTVDVPLFLGDLELAESPEFAQCYEETNETIEAPGNRWLREVHGTNSLLFTYYVRVC